MPPDPDATLDSAADPSQDQPDESQDTDADTQENTGDWERRYKELQKHTSRREALLNAQLEALSGDNSDEGDAEPEGDAGDDEDDAQQPVRRRGEDRLESESWELAESRFGSPAIRAYTRSAVVLQRAQTPADFVAAFESYHQLRLDQESRSSRRTSPAPGNQPEQPRVESNRPDASPRNDLDRMAEEALAKGDSRSWFQAQVRRVRGE